MRKLINSTLTILTLSLLSLTNNVNAQITVTKTDETCKNCNNGTATVKVEGGTPPYEYIWPNGAGGNHITGLAPGYYVVVIVDANDCSGSKGFTIEGYQEPPDPFAITVRISSDPNDITGPAGFGDAHWISVNDELPYRVRFENNPKFATAPANKVAIYFPFDNAANMFSFQVGSFSFRGITITPPAKASNFNKRLNLADSIGVNIDVTAGIDVTQKRAFWIFQAIDPTTGLPNENPEKGFILVNDTLTHMGEGEINFTLKAKPTVQTGDTLKAYANIVFDANETIPTNITWNKIDAKPPVSKIKAVNLLNSDNVELVWTGADDTNGSGVGNYKIMLSSGSQPYAQVSSTTDTSAIVSLPGGNEYRLQTVSLDNTKNSEKLKSMPDTVIFLTPTVRLGNDGGFCKGDSTELNAGSGFDTYTWNTGSNKQRIYVKTPGTYYVTAVKDTIVSSDTIVIVENPLPVPTLHNNLNVFCEGTTLDLKPGNGFKKYLWSNLQTTATIGVTSPGTYQVTVTDNNGCQASDSLNVTMYNSPVFTLGNDTSVEIKDTVYLVPKPSGFVSYLWNNGSINDSLLLTIPPELHKKYNYWLRVTDSHGCQYTDTIAVTFIPGNGVEFANAEKTKIMYYPNPISDYLNLRIESSGLQKITVSMYTIDGILVKTKTYNTSKTLFTDQWTLNKQSVGAYILKFTCNDTEISRTIIKQ